MEISIDTLINIATIFLGGGSGAFFVWRWQRKKAKAEAQEAEVNMAQEVQETYQKMLADKQGEVEDKNRIIQELRQDRDHFRQDRNELRERQDKTDTIVRELQTQVARNGRQIECMRPFLCADLSCRLRKRVVISEEGEIKEAKQRKSTMQSGKGANND